MKKNTIYQQKQITKKYYKNQKLQKTCIRIHFLEKIIKWLQNFYSSKILKFYKLLQWPFSKKLFHKTLYNKQGEIKRRKHKKRQWAIKKPKWN